MRLYLETTLVSDFKLMAHLALRPEEFDDQVQFAGQEDDGLDKEGKPYTKRTGGYALDPLFKERLALLRFRLSKFLPDCPREVEVSAEMTTVNLIALVQQTKQRLSMSSTPVSTLPPTDPKTNLLPNGSANSLVIVK